jgi:hypothetical protein
MGGSLSYEGKSRSVLDSNSPDPSPLRRLYVSVSDDLIYAGVRNFFSAVNRVLWAKADPDSLIRKTVGVQALFDVARSVMADMASKKNFREAEFEKMIQPAGRLDFGDSFFQTSGTGRQRIRNCLELSIGLKSFADIKSDQGDYQRLLK